MNVASHANELLNLVHHLVAPAQDLRQSLNLINIFLSEPEALLQQLVHVLTDRIRCHWHFFFLIDQLNDGSR